MVVRARLLSFLFLFLLLPTPAAAQLDSMPEPPAAYPIVGGEIEPGWPSVGALTTSVVGLGYMGSFCSGTLIAPQWVLTAAHCLTTQAQMPITPELVQFYMGPDANMTGFGQKPDGVFVQADAFFVHPAYDSSHTYNDIALMHLAEPAEGAEPIAYRRNGFAQSMQGESILYVGYGVNDGVESTGGGVKRSGSMRLEDWDQWLYVSNYAESGVCFGDSGGPGLYEDENGWKVVGVNSAVWSESGDPCSGSAVHTKVDGYVEFIEEHLEGPQPNCLDDEGLCWCEGACQEDGICDNSVCQVESCYTVYECLDLCENDQSCRARCYVSASEEANSVLQEMVYCYYMNCQNGGSSQDFDTCVREQCPGALGKCIPLETGNHLCNSVVGCLEGCEEYDAQCVLDCYNSGTEEAKTQAKSLIDCYADNCQRFPNPGHRWDCGWEACAAEIETCFPPAECDARGGDCNDGKTCYPNPLGKFDCFKSDDLQLGDACDAVDMDHLYCGDGLYCSGMNGDGLCVEFCFNDEDCNGNGQCLAPLWSGFDTLGICNCTDQDGDGFCAGDDCNDNNKKQNPGTEEICGNNRDDNCNGQVDEGCDKTDDTEDEGAIGNLPFVSDTSSGGCSHGPAHTSALPLFFFILLGLGLLRRANAGA